MTDLLKDIRYGFRMLAKSPGFTFVAVLSLALGIGFNTAIFSAVDALLLKPESGLESDRFVDIFLSDSSGYPYGVSSYPDYREYRDRTSGVFSEVVAVQTTLMHYREGTASEYLYGEIVTGNFFGVMGIPALIGRTLLPEDDVSPGGHPVVVVSEAFWRERFGADPEALGSDLVLNGRAYSIVGVVPESFSGNLPGFSASCWVPAAMVDQINPLSLDGDSRLERRTNRSWFAKARLRPGVTIDQARARMSALSASLQEEYPDAYGERSFHLLPSTDVRIHPMIDKPLVTVATVLMGIVALVLLIACANVANMLLARAASRQREVAIRLTLGSSRWRLVRQLLTESILLSGIGGALGLLIAYWCTELLLALKPPIPIPVALDLSFNPRVLFFTLAASVATGVVFGLAPALQSSRAQLVPSLKPGERTALGLRRLSLRNALVVLQVAVSLLLVIGAVLMLRSVWNAQRVDPGFETEQIVMVSTHLGLHGYDQGRGQTFFREAADRVEALPEIESVSLADKMPLGAGVQTRTIAPEEQQGERIEDWPELDVATVAPGYFHVMGIPLVRGRDFAARDDSDSPGVVILNETAARRLWPGESPLGKRIATASSGRLWEVIAVARDAKVRTIGEDPRAQVYFTVAQDYSPLVYVIARTHTAPELALESIRREILQIDPNLAFFEAKTMQQNLAITLFPVRMGALLLGTFGALALTLAGVGLYGVVAYSVSRRTKEIGIRMALGATRRQVHVLVTQQGFWLVMVGIVLGLVAAVAGTRVLSTVLYGIDTTDVTTYAGTALLLLAVALTANWVPARRAASVNPVRSLRQE